MIKPFRVLCVGGSDSGGGAGIQADLKAVDACGCYGTNVVTALTAQNTLGVQDIFPVPGRFIAAQMDSILGDIGTDAVKTGMLLNKGAMRVVSEKIHQYRLKKVVVDPVMIAKGGKNLMQENARRALVELLLPSALMVTPNVPEAEVLSGMNIRSMAEMKKAAVAIRDTGVKNVVIKGGHLPGSRRAGSIDILFDGNNFHEYAARWISARNTHGTGCTFASALAAHLARGMPVDEAVNRAKQIVTKSIQNGLFLGKGHGPVHAGKELLSRRPENECLAELERAVMKLTNADKGGRLIPEVSSNLVYARQGAENENDVAGFSGRIIRLNERACAVSVPAFGASQHMAHVVLTVMSSHPDYRCAMNIRYSGEMIGACQKCGFVAESFNRADEPREQQNRDGCTLEWGVHQVMQRSGRIPDIIYDTGGWGKEPMIRVLGRNPDDVIGKALAILSKL